MTVQSEGFGIFDEVEKGRIGCLTSDKGMLGLFSALETTDLPWSIADARNIDERVLASSLIEDYQIKIANIAMDATLEGDDVRDLDLRDDIRWQVRPYVGNGLRLGHKIARELLNG